MNAVSIATRRSSATCSARKGWCQSMIPKSGFRFSERSCSTNKLKRDDESKRSHHALVAWEGGRPRRPSFTPE
jgi:hypothetical protein